MEKQIKPIGKILCPKCGAEFLIAQAHTDEDKDKSNEACQKLLKEWNNYIRNTSGLRDEPNDDARLSWLSGRIELLRDAGLNKYEALRWLKRKNGEVKAERGEL